MADLLERGQQFLDDQRHAHMTHTVTYERGNESVELQATIGETVFEQADDYGVIHKIESRDFIIRTCDLMLDSVQTLPAVGDRLRDSDGDTEFVYEVMAPGQEPAFRYSDPYRKALRIHTKRIS